MATKLKNLSKQGIKNLDFIPVGRYDKDHGGIYGDDRYIAAAKQAAAYKGVHAGITAGYANYGHSNGKGGEHLAGALDFDGLRYKSAAEKQKFVNHLKNSGLYDDVFVEKDGHIHGRLKGVGSAGPQSTAPAPIRIDASPVNLPAAPEFKPNKVILESTPAQRAGIGSNGDALQGGSILKQNEPDINKTLSQINDFVEKNRHLAGELGKRSEASIKDATTYAATPPPASSGGGDIMAGLQAFLDGPPSGVTGNQLSNAMAAGVDSGVQAITAPKPNFVQKAAGDIVGGAVATGQNLFKTDPYHRQTNLPALDAVNDGLLQGIQGLVNVPNALGLSQDAISGALNNPAARDLSQYYGLDSLRSGAANAIPILNTIAPNIVSQQGHLNITPSEGEDASALYPAFNVVGQTLPYVAGGALAGVGKAGAGIVPTLLRNAAVDAGIGALATDAPLPQRIEAGAINAGLGAATLGAGYGVSKLLGKAAKQAVTVEERSAALEALRRFEEEGPIEPAAGYQAPPFIPEEANIIAPPQQVVRPPAEPLKPRTTTLYNADGSIASMVDNRLPTAIEARDLRMPQEAPPHAQLFDPQGRVIDSVEAPKGTPRVGEPTPLINTEKDLIDAYGIHPNEVPLDTPFPLKNEAKVIDASPVTPEQIKSHPLEAPRPLLDSAGNSLEEAPPLLDAQGNPLRPTPKVIDAQSPAPVDNVRDIRPKAKTEGNVFTDEQGGQVFHHGRDEAQARELIASINKTHQVSNLADALQLTRDKLKAGVITAEEATLRDDNLRTAFEAGKQGKTLTTEKVERKEGYGKLKTREELIPIAISDKPIQPETFVENLHKKFNKDYGRVVDYLRGRANANGFTASTSGRTPRANALNIARQLSQDPHMARVEMGDTHVNVQNYRTGGTRTTTDAHRGYPLDTLRRVQIGANDAKLPEGAVYANQIHEEFKQLDAVRGRMNLSPVENKTFDRIQSSTGLLRSDVQKLKRILSDPKKLAEFCSQLGFH